MSETVIKIAGIPLLLAMALFLSRVIHTRPELITNFFAQVGNAAQQTPKSSRASLEARAKKCGIALDTTGLTDKQMNDIVYLCESKKNGNAGV